MYFKAIDNEGHILSMKWNNIRNTIETRKKKGKSNFKDIFVIHCGIFIMGFIRIFRQRQV